MEWHFLHMQKKKKSMKNLKTLFHSRWVIEDFFFVVLDQQISFSWVCDLGNHL